ncbi:MAG: hypothetical protein MJZ08_02545 [Bacteroidaceae bacterium]|nr:hypothetical protein [Bacteroidaceae bacterium]
MSVPAEIEKYQKVLFLNADELSKAQLPAIMHERVIRLRSLYSYWLQFPQKGEKELLHFDMQKFSLQERQAYDDIFIVKYLLGNLQVASKEFHRWKFNNMIMAAYKEAEHNHDARSMAAAADKYGKYNNLDKVDQDDMGFDKIIPQGFEPTSDPRVIGINKDAGDIRKQVKKLIEEWNNEKMNAVQYIDYENVEEEKDPFDINPNQNT